MNSFSLHRFDWDPDRSNIDVLLAFVASSSFDAAAFATIVEQELEQRRKAPRQLNLFEDGIGAQEEKAQQENLLERERKVQQAVLNIKKMFGKNAILKGVNFDEGATAIERNSQIGGHKA